MTFNNDYFISVCDGYWDGIEEKKHIKRIKEQKGYIRKNPSIDLHTIRLECFDAKYKLIFLIIFCLKLRYLSILTS